jgi:hypothetical protein
MALYFSNVILSLAIILISFDILVHSKETNAGNSTANAPVEVAVQVGKDPICKANNDCLGSTFCCSNKQCSHPTVCLAG